MKLDPPPQVNEFNWIWQKWFLTLFNSFAFNTSFSTVITTPVTADSSKFILVDDDVIGGDAVVNLPPASNEGRAYHIKKLGTTGLVTVDGSGSETIDDGLTAVLADQYESIKIVSDGSNWWVI